MDIPAEDEWPGCWTFAIVVIVLCWVFSMLSILSLLILPLLGFTLFRASRGGKWRLMLLVSLANPLGVYFIMGVADYARGAPKLHYMGLPSIEFYNIDPRTRSFSQTGGCVVHGNEWVFHASHNLGVLAISTVFGPPSQSYDGPYPTKEEALRLASAAPAINVVKFQKGRIPVGGETLEMDPEQIRGIAQDLRIFALMDDGMDPDPSEIKVQAALFERRCLILRFVEVSPYADTAQSGKRDFITLFDRKNMRPFAYFRISGDSAARCPRIQYLPGHSR